MRILTALILALGLAAAGWLVGSGLKEMRTGDRYVTVKGMAEREVVADLAIWPLRYVAAADELEQAQASIERSRQAVLKFLTQFGIKPEQVELQRLEVTDTMANPYQQHSSANRYIINHNLLVRSEDIGQVQAASQSVSQLIDAGVVLTTDYGMGGPTYLFKGLNAIKLELIAEATAAARSSAEQFAQDAQARLGGLRRANQGVIQILPRDQIPGASEENQATKIVRVVSTLEYYLAD